jgi:hypothetical protein
MHRFLHSGATPHALAQTGLLEGPKKCIYEGVKFYLP